jgi:glycerol-3-phosphate acyltransferase PlsX
VIRIALDASGGDHAPDVPVAGAIAAIRELPASFRLMLVGPRAQVEAALARQGVDSDRITVVDAPEGIGVGDRPIQAVGEEPGSSITVGLDLQRQGEADAFVSAGNTGVVLEVSTLSLGLHPGIERPAIGALLPTVSRPVLLLDAGANVDCCARELLGFAHVGVVYAREILGRNEPTVGLLNIGEESWKGSGASQEAYGALERARSGFRFVGNVEGSDALSGSCDVIVCDGFVGNILLKFCESVARLYASLLERELEQTVLQGEAMRRVFKVLDYAEAGGAPLLGVRGVSIVCHGHSSAHAIRNAVRVAVESVDRQLSLHIGAEFAKNGAAA